MIGWGGNASYVDAELLHPIGWRRAQQMLRSGHAQYAMAANVARRAGRRPRHLIRAIETKLENRQTRIRYRGYRQTGEAGEQALNGKRVADDEPDHRPPNSFAAELSRPGAHGPNLSSGRSALPGCPDPVIAARIYVAFRGGEGVLVLDHLVAFLLRLRAGQRRFMASPAVDSIRPLSDGRQDREIGAITKT